MVKNSLLFLFFFVFLFGSQDWVVKLDNHVWYESDFYRFFPESDWKKVSDNNKKTKIVTGFLKQNIAAQKALGLGLQYSQDVNLKLSARYKMLMVNEYYMRHFLSSLIPPSALYFCGQNLKKDVFAKHVLIKPLEGQTEDEAALLKKATTIKDSILSGGSFEFFATQYSQDPSAQKNSGSLGWISIGQTVTEFQDALFGLCLGCVDVVKTDFGFHVVQVDSIRESKYNLLSQEEYDDYVFRFASSYITAPLKDVAAEHDSMLISTEGVVFDSLALIGVVDKIVAELKLKNGNRKDVDVIKILKEDLGVVVKYNSNFLSSGWFANKIENSLHRSVFYASFEEIKKDFETILLRDIAYKKGVELGLDSRFSFVSQFDPVRLGVLEKAYLSFLVSSVEKPTDKEIKDYFSLNAKGQDLNVAYKSIETILLQQKQEAAKNLFFSSIENRENIIINKEWFNE